MSDHNADVRSRQLKLLIGFISVIGVLVVGGMVLFDTKPAMRTEKLKTVAISAPGTIDDKDAWRAQEAAKQKANAEQIRELKAELAQQEEKHKKVEEELKKNREMTDAAGLNQALPDSKQQILHPPYGGGTTNMNTPSGMTAGASLNAASLNTPLNNAVLEAPKQELEIIQFSNTTKTGPASLAIHSTANKLTSTGDAKSASGMEFIPAGSFVRAVMLNGIDAPTGGQAQSNPLPVALHVLDTANLANQYKLNIKDCRFIAAAWGDLSSERGMARTETLTCIINDETVEMPIKGQIIGEDGKAGMRGRLVTKQGQILANALLAGIASGIGEAFQQSATTQSISPLGATATIQPGDVGRAALGAGMGNAGNALEQYYLRAADKLFPVIEIDGGRTVEVLVTKGAVYNGKAANFSKNYRGIFKRTGATLRENDED